MKNNFYNDANIITKILLLLIGIPIVLFIAFLFLPIILIIIGFLLISIFVLKKGAGRTRVFTFSNREKKRRSNLFNQQRRGKDAERMGDEDQYKKEDYYDADYIEIDNSSSDKNNKT